MPSAAVAALRLEVLAANAVIEPQLRGMQDLAHVSLSPETLGYISAETTAYSRRYALQRKVVEALDALEADGYPEINKVELPTDSYGELLQEKIDLMAAIGEFVGAVAANISVDLGPIVDKPEESKNG